MTSPHSDKRHRRPRLLALALALLVLTGCDLAWLAPLPDAEGPAALFQSSAIVLRIENQSGLSVAIEAVFLVGEVQVRRTQRHLAANGVEAVDEVAPTDADRVIVTARAMGPEQLPAGWAVGDVLHAGVFERGVDYFGGETIVFVITAPEQPDPGPGPDPQPQPGPIDDCNGNGIPDATDVASGASTDCDRDGTPDECQLLEDADGNGTPDLCEPSGDLTGDGAVDLEDVPLFIAVLLGHNQEPAAIAAADMNRDGAANGDDVQGFVAAILEAR